MSRGIDLSHWNDRFGLDVINDYDIELDFVIAKHSEGHGMVDNWFSKYREATHRRGIIFSGYHFFNCTAGLDGYAQLIKERLIDIAHVSSSRFVWIDWEHDYTKESYHTILDAIKMFDEEYGDEHGITVGIYSNFSTFYDKSFCDEGINLAQDLDARGIPLWVARYKSSSYRQDLSSGAEFGAVLLQRRVHRIIPTINQFTDKCWYNGRGIEMDYNVAFKRL